MAKVLLFNLRDETRRKKVKALLFRYGIPSREAAPAEQGKPLRDLLEGASGETPAEAAGEPFSEEMIVMHGLSPRQFHGLLDGMKAQGVRVPLKAVTTETNLAWTAFQLREELLAEERAMASGSGPAHGQT